jgi:hypothetical protein
MNEKKNMGKTLVPSVYRNQPEVIPPDPAEPDIPVENPDEAPEENPYVAPEENPYTAPPVEIPCFDQVASKGPGQTYSC